MPNPQIDLIPAPNRQSAIANRQSTALPVLDQRLRGTSFHEVPVKAILNSPATTGMGFWSLNPYVGCEFGCTYCYARETHKWVVERAEQRHQLPIDDGRLPSDPADEPNRQSPIANRQSLPPWLAFERQILVKTSAAAVLTRTLFPARLGGATLLIGTATDPYQPAERRFRLTRSILEALLSWRGLSLGITTKSPLILRDLSLLQELSRRHELGISISLASVDSALLRRLEPRSPAAHARLRALERLTAAGIHAGLMVAPVLPGISDSREALAAIMAAGKAAGAHYVTGAALRLGTAARARFLPHLSQEFPELEERYLHRYARGESPGRDYEDALAQRIHSLQREYGFPVTDRPPRRSGHIRRRRHVTPVTEEQRSLL